jgi:hypothetical protein
MISEHGSEDILLISDILPKLMSELEEDVGDSDLGVSCETFSSNR